MAFDPLTALLDVGSKVLDRVIPDKAKQAEQKLKLQELHAQGDMAKLNAEVQLMLGQLEINKMDASSKNMFQAGWRPFIGWSSAITYVYAGLLEPIIRMIATFCGYTGEYPVLDTGAMVSVLMAMLGVAGLRSFDKKNDTHTK